MDLNLIRNLKAVFSWKAFSETPLQILKRYGCLWLLDRTRDKRPNLVIVNLQWTPKDDAASLKINGKVFILFMT